MRDTLDRYYTPDACAAAVVRWLDLPPRSLVVEPSVGGGAFARALVAAGLRVHGVDIDPGAAGLVACESAHVGDWLRVTDLPRGVHAIVGNPPYRASQEHAEHALTLCPQAALLLPLSVLASRARLAWWARRPPARVGVLVPRPKFLEQGTAQAEYCVVEWRPADTAGRIEWIDWR